MWRVSLKTQKRELKENPLFKENNQGKRSVFTRLKEFFTSVENGSIVLHTRSERNALANHTSLWRDLWKENILLNLPRIWICCIRRLYLWVMKTMVFLYYTRFRRLPFFLTCGACDEWIHKLSIIIWVWFIFNYFSSVLRVNIFL